MMWSVVCGPCGYILTDVLCSVSRIDGEAAEARDGDPQGLCTEAGPRQPWEAGPTASAWRCSSEEQGLSPLLWGHAGPGAAWAVVSDVALAPRRLEGHVPLPEPLLPCPCRWRIVPSRPSSPRTSAWSSTPETPSCPPRAPSETCSAAGACGPRRGELLEWAGHPGHPKTGLLGMLGHRLTRAQLVHFWLAPCSRPFSSP